MEVQGLGKRRNDPRYGGKAEKRPAPDLKTGPNSEEVAKEVAIF